MDTLPLTLSAKIKRNTGEAELVELAIARGEGQFSAGGALAVETGVHTGPSPVAAPSGRLTPQTSMC